MEFAKRSNEQIVASEAFTPVLSGEYIERYSTLIEKLAGVLPANRVRTSPPTAMTWRTSEQR